MKMKALAIAILLALILAPTAVSEADFSAWDEFSPGATDILRELTAGEGAIGLEEAFSGLWEALARELRSALKTGIAICAIGIICAASGMLALKLAALEWLGALAASAVFLGAFAGALDSAGTALKTLSAFSDIIWPAMAALLVSSGAPNTAAMLTPAASFTGLILTDFVSEWGLALCACATALAVASELSRHVRLDKLFRLLVKFNNYSMGAVITVFLGVVSVQAALSASYDSAGVKAAKYAVDNLLPVVGGEVKDAVAAIAKSASLTKNAAGVTGLVLLFGAAAGPIIRLAAILISLRFAAAVCDCLCQGSISKIADRFADCAAMLMASTVTGAVLNVLLIGACLTAGARG